MEIIWTGKVFLRMFKQRPDEKNIWDLSFDKPFSVEDGDSPFLNITIKSQACQKTCASWNPVPIGNGQRLKRLGIAEDEMVPTIFSLHRRKMLLRFRENVDPTGTRKIPFQQRGDIHFSNATAINIV